MKKTVIALLLAGLLAGCSSNQASGSKNTGDSSTKSTRQVKRSAKKAKSNRAVASSSSSSASSASSASASSSTSSSDSGNHYQQLTKQIQSKVGNQWLPDSVKANGVVNASASTTASGSSVKFYSGDSAVDLNDSTLSNKGADYSLDKKSYASSSAAAAAINWIGSQGGQTVNLGDNITATKQGAAGSIYMHWNEGNWSITVRASNVNGEDPTALAKQLVALFHTESLPAPSNKGAASFNVSDGAGSQTITWNDGANVYTFSGRDALATAQTAAK